MKRRKRWNHSICPICLKKQEDNDHFLNCKGKSARKTWKLAVQELIEKLEEIDTEPYICTVIEERLMNWPKVPKKKF